MCCCTTVLSYHALICWIFYFYIQPVTPDRVRPPLLDWPHSCLGLRSDHHTVMVCPNLTRVQDNLFLSFNFFFFFFFYFLKMLLPKIGSWLPALRSLVISRIAMLCCSPFKKMSMLFTCIEYKYPHYFSLSGIHNQYDLYLCTLNRLIHTMEVIYHGSYCTCRYTSCLDTFFCIQLMFFSCNFLPLSLIRYRIMVLFSW